MRVILKRLKNRRGESLVEVLIATMIIALAITMMITMVASSVRMDKDIREADKELYDTLNGELVRAEMGVQIDTLHTAVKLSDNAGNVVWMRAADGSPTDSISVQPTGTEDGLIAYREGTTGP